MRAKKQSATKEDWPDVTVEQVTRNVLRYNGVVRADKIKVTRALFRCDLETDVEQLAQVLVVFPARRLVA